MIVGTAGHVDHGKTALVHALTGVDTDRLQEEKARGMTIDLGFAYLPAPGGDIIGFVDVPGHERFVHTMLAGASGIDFVLLVVAADDGVMPQTLEHLAIVDLLGIRRGAVVLSKSDLADTARRAAVAAEIRADARGNRARRSRIDPCLGRHGRRHRYSQGSPVRGGVTLCRPRGLGPLQTGGGPLVHAARRRHGRDRHRAVGRGQHRRQRRGEPVGTVRACPLDPCAEPAGRARQGGRSLRAQPGRRRRRQGSDPARRRDTRSGASRADRPHRRQAARPAAESPNRSANGFRCGCTMPRPRSGRGSCSSATTRSGPAASPRSSWCWTARSPRRRATLSSCATPPRSGRSAAEAFSTSGRPAASAARRNGLPGSKRTPSRSLSGLSPRCSTRRPTIST